MVTPIDYVRLRKMADRLLEKFGTVRTVSIRRASGYNLVTDDLSVTTSQGTADAVKLEVERRFWGETAVKEAKAEFYISALDITAEPEPGSKILDSTRTWTVIDSRPLQPASLVLLYRVLVK